MDSVSIATSLLAAKADQTRTAIAARMMAMDAQGDTAVLGLLQAAARQGTGIAAPAEAAPQSSRLLDISV